MTNQTLMRQLDRLIGIPLCWLVTLFTHRLTRRQMHLPGSSPKGVLFIQLAESGSMVLADPALRHIQTRSGAKIFMLTLEETRPSLDICATVPSNQIYTLTSGSLFRFILDTIRLRSWIKEKEIDAVIDLEIFTRFSALLAFWSGIKHRVGFSNELIRAPYRGQLFNYRVAYNPHIHISKNYLLLSQALLQDLPKPQQAHPYIPDAALVISPRKITTSEQQQCKQILSTLGINQPAPLILINANASNRLPQRRWPASSFVTLIQQLITHSPNLTILLIGADEDWSSADKICSQVNHTRCINGAGFFSLPQLIALFHRSKLMISNDSGPAHFAAVTSMPVITLFGPETPQLYKPLGVGSVISAGLSYSPCVSAANQRKTRCRDNHCMQQISIDQVHVRALSLLKGHHNATLICDKHPAEIHQTPMKEAVTSST
jgi:ADP-heptose:LPS heptosyltransferase